jgi:hypothetical protein
MPIIDRGCVLGIARGRPFPDRRVDLDLRKMWAGFATYDAIINAQTAGSKFRFDVTKIASTAPVAANWYDLWPVTGQPTQGAYGGTAATAKPLNDTAVGSIPHGGNVSTATKHLTSIYMNASGGTPTLMLYDRVLTYEACVFTAASSQGMTNTLSAARYVSAGQSGMKIARTCQTAYGATAANLTVCTYVDQAGTGSITAPTTTAIVLTVSCAAPTANLGARIDTSFGPFLPMAQGSPGARSITNYTTSAANTGTTCWILARPLAVVPISAAGVTTMMDTVMQVASLERIYDGACLSWLALFPAATAATFTGGFETAWA